MTLLVHQTTNMWFEVVNGNVMVTLFSFWNELSAKRRIFELFGTDKLHPKI
jgi:hypothetical protein